MHHLCRLNAASVLFRAANLPSGQLSAREAVFYSARSMTTAQLTTAELNVAGVEVVSKQPKRRAFSGPFYADQIDLLRGTLRGMPKRDLYVVYAGEASNWIYRKS